MKENREDAILFWTRRCFVMLSAERMERLTLRLTFLVRAAARGSS